MKKKAAEVVTKDLLDDAVETILQGVESLVDEKVGGLKSEVKAGFNQVNTRLEKLDNEIMWVKGDVKGIRSDLSDTVTRKEHNGLEGRVRKLEVVSGVIA